MSGKHHPSQQLDPREEFFARLPAIEQFHLVPEVEQYTQAPDSWLLVITDVIGSTAAIEAGRYKDVNALGVASIVALRNALQGVELPFVFGGDGATILAPGSRLPAVERALRGVQRMATRAFELEMRAGLVPIATLREAGHPVLVARYKLSSEVWLAMLAGDGISAGERWVKDPERGRQYAVRPEGETAADFTGFECRWNPVASRRGQVVSLLVQAREGGAQTYRRVIEKIEQVLQQRDAGCPVSTDTLRLSRFGAQYGQEARIRSGRARGARFQWARLRARVSTLIGRLLIWSGIRAGGFDGRRYRDEVTANTDFRKFDDTLRMVLDMSAEQLRAIEGWLEEEQQAGRVFYGIHTSSSAMLTCVIDDYAGKHLHFVDGSDGGYALAAKQLKQQQKQAADDQSRGAATSASA